MSDALSELGRAAVWYCEHGFAIFPLKPRSKVPATVHGMNDWFDDPESARELWGKFPDYNIGIVCGAPSHGLLVLDLDVSDEKDGRKTLATWERSRGNLPETAMAITGGGGRHYLYRTSRTNIRPSANHDLGVDVRCDGSYIVAPPSVHPSGSLYEWWESPKDTPVATADDSVMDFLDYVQRNGGHDEDKPVFTRFELPARIRKGERNDVLFRYGRSLRGQGYPDAIIESLLRDANNERCDESIPTGELMKLVESVCSVGPGHNGMGSFKSDRVVGAPGQSTGSGGGQGEDLPDFHDKRGGIIHWKLGQIIIDYDLARCIDGAPAVWTGTRWAYGKDAITSITLNHAIDAKRAVRDEVYSFVMSKAPSVTSESFDGRYYVQFANATYDVMRGDVVEPTSDMLITATVPVELDLDGTCYGEADRFLDSLAKGDQTVVTALCEIIGACMCSRRVLSQSPMLIGRGGTPDATASNGKSTYLNVLRALLGPENVSSLDIATLGQRFQAARVVGKLANLGDDIPDGFLRGEELALFKKLVTGDQIYTDVKGGEGYEFRPSATFVFSMNTIPRLTDTTEGVFRRLAFVPFRNVFSPGTAGYDPDILTKLTTAENLRRFAVLGLMALPALIRRGALIEIPDMSEEVEMVRNTNSVVRRWMVDEDIARSDIDHVSTSAVYERFNHWCEESGERFGVTKTTFSRDLIALLSVQNCHVSTEKLTNGRTGKRERHYVFHDKNSVSGG